MNLLITGSCGFIGSHAANRFLAGGHQVIGFDNLSRPGAAVNLDNLRRHCGFEFVHGDVRFRGDVLSVFESHGPFDVIIHEAAQTAVTTSVAHPVSDFEVNTMGTLNLLEATRRCAPEAVFLYASTNKVYGNIGQMAIREYQYRYAYESSQGISEEQPLDFHSPYGCSKGAADQYVRDYSRVYGLNTVVLRQSCIYGPNQFGVEDQGWVAWFTIAGILGRPVTIYGNGKQVRDLLWIDDLIDLYCRVIDRGDAVKGRIYNAGGSSKHCLSLLELLTILNRDYGCRITPTFASWRPGDQRIFVSDCSAACSELGWVPGTPPDVGVDRLVAWVRSNRGLVEAVLRKRVIAARASA